MTGYTVHTGSSKKFAAGWDRIFEGGTKSTQATKPETAKARPASKTPRTSKKAKS